MLSDEKKLILCENIIKTELFQKAPKSSALLKYLVKATLAGDFLKEDIIDLEFFGDKSISDKNNPRVRVNVYNLRKKIELYYKTDGQDIQWRLIIDKGQYSVRFEKLTPNTSTLEKIKLKNVIPYLLLVALSIIFIFSNLKPEPPVVWESFFKNKKATTLIVGDVFGMTGKTITNNEGWTRDFSINSTEDYYAFMENNSELKEIIKPANYTYITSMGVIAVQHVAKLFYDLNSNFGIRFSSHISVDDLKNGNLIYVGQYINNTKLTSLFNNFNPYFKITNQHLIVSGHPNLKDTIYTTYFGKESEDFSIVSRFKGPKNNECFIFFSNHDMGVKATIEHFTDNEFLKKFNKEHMAEKDNFTAIYQVYGKDRTNLGLKSILVVPF
ncbi:helix-turn-helix domain-containing protein [Flavobacterium ovatum]|uniref:helix-turn-helix domain-containing protein n=1 Tax=Flavobacterium ovatum TaxID=1928857 RepID=UPI00344FD093